MMPDFDKIRNVILQNSGGFQKVISGTFTVVETFNDNNGVEQPIRMIINVTSDTWYIEKFDNKNKNLKSIFKKQKCSDTVVWQYDNRTNWSLHILEIKKSVTRDEWGKIKNQFLGAYRLCRMIAIALDIEFETVRFYTAFVNDKISSPTSRNTIEDTESDGTDFTEPDLDISDDTILPETEWQSHEIQFNDYGWQLNYTDRRCPHSKLHITNGNNDIYEETFAIP